MDDQSVGGEHELPNLVKRRLRSKSFSGARARIAADKLRLFAWLRYGSTIFDVARTPYAPITEPGVKVALMVESAPTSFIRRHEHAARAYGPFPFECTAFGQRYDDCVYLPLNHDELYVRFAEVWPELLAFIRTSRFTSTITGRRRPATARTATTMTPETTVTDPLHAPRRVLATREAAWAKALARWLGRAGVRPNSVSLAGVVFAFSGCAGFVVVPDLVGGARALTLVLTAAAIQLRLLCNLLDGMLAVEEGFKSKTGEIYNDLPDRVADVLILVGAGYSLRDLAVWRRRSGGLAAVLALSSPPMSRCWAARLA